MRDFSANHRVEKAKTVASPHFRDGHMALRDLTSAKRKFEKNNIHITSVLRNLHWLPIGHFRITFGLFFKASPGAHLFI